MVAHVFNPSTGEAETGGHLCEFKASLVYKASPGQDPKIQRNAVSKKEWDCILSLLLFYFFLLLWGDTMPKTSFQKKALNGTDSFRGWVHDGHGREHGSRKQAWCGSSSWELTSWNTWGRKKTNSHASSNNATPSNPSHTVLQTGGQLFKYLCLWESFSFRQPHSIPVPVGL